MLVIVGLMLSVSSNLWAAPPGPNALPVAVVAVKTDDALDQAEALTQALRKAVRNAPGWSLGESTQSLEFLVVKLKCNEPIDAACETQIADVIKSDRYIWSVIRFADEGQANIVGTVNFFVRGQGTRSAPLNYTANLTDPNADGLIKVATDALSQVTGGAPKGTVNISAGGVAGQVFIDDQPMGALAPGGGSFQLPAGDHRIVVKSPGYADAETTVSIRPLAVIDSSVTMIEMEESAPVDGKLIGGIAALGIGAAALGVGIWGATIVEGTKSDIEAETDPAYDLYLSRVPEEGGNFCDQDSHIDKAAPPGVVTKHCDNLKQGELTQAIAFPVAGVAAGVGLILILTSPTVGGEAEADDSPLADLRVQPIVGPGVQALSVSGRF